MLTRPREGLRVCLGWGRGAGQGGAAGREDGKMLWDMAVQHGRRRTQGQVSHLDVEDIGEIFLGVLPDQVESVRNVDR